MTKIYELDGTLLGSVNNARARVLLKSKMAKVKQFKPYELYSLKPLKNLKRMKMHFIGTGEQAPRNLDQVCRIELNEKTNSIMFYYTTFSARLSAGGDLQYKSIGESRDAFEKIKAVALTRNWVTYKNELINLDNVCNISLNQKDNKILFFMVAETARTNWSYKNERDAEEAFKILITDNLKSASI